MQPSTNSHDTGAKTTSSQLLADFCRDELAAAEAYKRALELDPLKKHADVLARCYASHQQRAVELRHRIADVGAVPPSAPGAWASLIPTLTTAAAAVSEKLAVSMLEQTEDRGVLRYRDHQNDLEAGDREFVIERIVPGQAATHAAMSQLKHAVAS